jgi:uncharacterized protein (TIGR04141 family)
MADRQHLTIFLVKDSVTDPAEILQTDPSGMTVLELEPGLELDGELYVKVPSSNEPSWFAFVAPALLDPAALSSLRNSSVSAVLLIRAAGRIFAVTFGYGRTMLVPEALEARFGLIVVLNAVDPVRLRSVDARTLEEVSLQTRRQLSRGGSIRSFELDLNRDLLRGVAGEPTKKGFADKLAGSIALAIDTEIDFKDVPAKCGDALTLYRKKTYRRRFPWVDHVQLITDPVQNEELDVALGSELARENYEILYLAAPEIIDYERVDHFRYTGDPTRHFYELDWGDYVSTIKRGPPTISRLRRETVAAYYAGSAQPDYRWSIYRCLVAELRQENSVNILSAGEWFRVETSFARKTLREAKTYEKPPDPLPPANEDEHEGPYNQRACQSIGANAVLMDTRNFRATEGQDLVEFCDILLRGRIIHVKRKSASSTLSHLFMQGLVSGELLQTDADFRRAASTDVANRSQQLANAIPATGPFDPAAYEIVFAVITKRPRRNRYFLPFFSQVSFTRVARLLTQRGYGVALVRIDETGNTG